MVFSFHDIASKVEYHACEAIIINIDLKVCLCRRVEPEVILQGEGSCALVHNEPEMVCSMALDMSKRNVPGYIDMYVYLCLLLFSLI